MAQTRTRKTPTQRTNNGIARRMSTLKTHNLRTLKKKTARKPASRKSIKPAAQEKTQSIANNLNKENLKCSICLELFVHPFQMPCRHIFCYMCIDGISRAKQLHKCCPLCRGPMGKPYPIRASEVYHKLRSSLLWYLERSQMDRYMDRLREVQQSFERRNNYMKDLVMLQQIGYKADNFWRIGRVVGMFRENNKQKVLVLSLNRRYQFIFDVTSCRLETIRALTAEFSLAQLKLFTQFSFQSLNAGNSDPQDISLTTIECSANPYAEPNRRFLESLCSSLGKQNSNC